MRTEIRHPGWRDELNSARYPFDDLATLVGDNDEFIPAELFVDAVLHVIGGDDTLYISQIDVESNSVTLTIGTETTPALATGVFDLLDPPGIVSLEDELERPAGMLIANQPALGIFQAWEQGVHTFQPEATRFSVAVTVPLSEPGVRGFLLDSGELVTGEVFLVGDNGIVLSHEIKTSTGPNGETEEYTEIRVDVVGDPLFRRRLCSPVFQTPRFLERVTFRQGCSQFTCVPDERGLIRITVGSRYGPNTVLRVEPRGNQLVIGAVGDLLIPE